MYFQDYRRRKTLLLKWLKCPVSEHPSIVNMLKDSKHCWNLHNSTFTIFFINLREIDCKTSLVVISEILGLFGNTLTADDKYSVDNSEKLVQSIQMQLII